MARNEKKNTIAGSIKADFKKFRKLPPGAKLLFAYSLVQSVDGNFGFISKTYDRAKPLAAQGAIEVVGMATVLYDNFQMPGQFPLPTKDPNTQAIVSTDISSATGGYPVISGSINVQDEPDTLRAFGTVKAPSEGRLA